MPVKKVLPATKKTPRKPDCTPNGKRRRKATLGILLRFGRRLRQQREQLDYSQEGFAVLLGIDRSYLSGIENGERAISLPVLECVADGLETSLSELLRGL